MIHKASNDNEKVGKLSSSNNEVGPVRIHIKHSQFDRRSSLNTYHRQPEAAARDCRIMMKKALALTLNTYSKQPGTGMARPTWNTCTTIN